MWLILLCSISIGIIITWYLYLQLHQKRKHDLSRVSTLIVIGSGGHTAEMISLVSNLPSHYYPRSYVMATNDNTSEVKITKLESLNKDPDCLYSIVKIPRSRNVHQSYTTSVLTTFYSTLRSIVPILVFSPDLVLCNGPGTCIPICVITYLFKKVLFWKTKIIFIESICRVKSLSLSGKILLRIADDVLVQWPELIQSYPKTVYLGRLM